MPYRRSNGSPPEAFRAIASGSFTLRTGASSSYLGSRAGGVPSSPPAVAPSRILRVCSSTTGLNTTLSPSRRHISSLTARHCSMMSLGSSAFRCFPYREAAHTMMWSCRWCRSVCVATTNLYSSLVMRCANSTPSSCTFSGVTGSSGLKLSLMWYARRLFFRMPLGEFSLSSSIGSVSAS